MIDKVVYRCISITVLCGVRRHECKLIGSSYHDVTRLQVENGRNGRSSQLGVGR
jgi:hypothetical protein